MTESELREIAARHGFSPDAVREVAAAFSRGTGDLAQFDHPELGGRGQWMPGMVQIGQMSNVTLRARVADLCADLAAAVDQAPSTEGHAMKQMQPMKPMKPMKPMAAPTAWWPDQLGSPSASGGQNGVRYAYFRGRQRLVVDVEGYVATYDTGDHVITGIAQSQADDASHIVFNAQGGDVSLDSLRAVVDGE